MRFMCWNVFFVWFFFALAPHMSSVTVHKRFNLKSVCIVPEVSVFAFSGKLQSIFRHEMFSSCKLRKWNVCSLLLTIDACTLTSTVARTTRNSRHDIVRFGDISFLSALKLDLTKAIQSLFFLVLCPVFSGITCPAWSNRTSINEYKIVHPTF